MRQTPSIKSPASVAAVLALAASVATVPAPTNRFPSYVVLYSQSNPKIIWGQTTNFIRGDVYEPPLPTSPQGTTREMREGPTPIVPLHISHSSRVSVDAVAGEPALGPLPGDPRPGSDLSWAGGREDFF